MSGYRRLTPTSRSWWTIRWLLARVALRDPVRTWRAYRRVRQNPQTPEQRMTYLREWLRRNT